MTVHEQDDDSTQYRFRNVVNWRDTKYIDIADIQDEFDAAQTLSAGQQTQAQDNIQVYSSTQFNNLLLEITTAPVVITLQSLRVGSTCNINLAQFTMKRIRA